MADPQEDEDEHEVEDLDAHLAAMAQATRAADPPADDYQRHLQAEAAWQNKRAAARLWERVKRWMVLGR